MVNQSTNKEHYMSKFESTITALQQAGYVPVPCRGKECALRPSWKERDEFTDAEWRQGWREYFDSFLAGGL